MCDEETATAGQFDDFLYGPSSKPIVKLVHRRETESRSRRPKSCRSMSLLLAHYTISYNLLLPSFLTLLCKARQLT